MAGVLGPNSGHPELPPPPPPSMPPLASEYLAVFTWLGCLVAFEKFQILTFSKTCVSPLGWVWVIIW